MFKMILIYGLSIKSPQLYKSAKETKKKDIFTLLIHLI